MENLKIDNILSNEKIVEVTTDTIEYKNLLSENTFLKHINSELLAKVDELTTRLHKYTNGENHKRYYEKNKEKIKQSGATYLQKLKTENPEKIKAYSKQAYANKKKKLLDASKFDASNNAQPLML
jgi:RPA family protein